jgi:hypothetical protein
MKHFFTNGGTGMTIEEEREELLLDMTHLSEQCGRYGCSDAPADMGGTGSVLFREKTRLFNIYNQI